MKDRANLGRRDFIALAGAAAAGAVLMAGPRVEAASEPVTLRESRRIPLELPEPSALAVRADGAVYVSGENVVAVLDPNGKETSRFDAPGRPGCLVALPSGLVLAGLRRQVLVFDAQGRQAAAWPDLGERAWLTSIAADEDHVFVADAGNRAVARFDHAGKLLGHIGRRDDALGVPGLNVPSPYFDVAIDPFGALWVVNPGRHGLEKYRADGSLVSSWYRPGNEAEAFCGCCNPIHIAFRSDSSLVTAEKGLNRVKVLAPDTSLLGVVWAQEIPPGAETPGLYCNVEPPIADLAVDADDRIFVLNRLEKALIVYEEARARSRGTERE